MGRVNAISVADIVTGDPVEGLCQMVGAPKSIHCSLNLEGAESYVVQHCLVAVVGSKNPIVA